MGHKHTRHLELGDAPVRHNRPLLAGARGPRLFSALSVGLELEEGHALIHRLGLLLQCFGGGGILLHQSRVLLRHHVHAGERFVDLLDAAGLFGAGIGDVGNNPGDVFD